jgi:DnaK suppressor protein
MSDSDERSAQRVALLRLHEDLSSLVGATSEGVKPVDLGEPIGRISRVDAMQQQPT